MALSIKLLKLRLLLLHNEAARTAARRRAVRRRSIVVAFLGFESDGYLHERNGPQGKESSSEKRAPVPI